VERARAVNEAGDRGGRAGAICQAYDSLRQVLYLARTNNHRPGAARDGYGTCGGRKGCRVPGCSICGGNHPRVSTGGRTAGGRTAVRPYHARAKGGDGCLERPPKHAAGCRRIADARSAGIGSRDGRVGSGSRETVTFDAHLHGSGPPFKGKIARVARVMERLTRQ
jgi:hypothetical protein